MPDQIFQLVPVDSLHPHPQNPRRGDLDLIRESVRTNGFYSVVIAQLSSRTILAGEHRWRAAKLEGLAYVPAVFVDVPDDVALRILLADNRLNDLAANDHERLVALLGMLNSPEGSGFSERQIQSLLGLIQNVEPTEEMQEAFDAALVRQITLVMSQAEFEWALPRFRAIQDANGYDTNVQVVLHLLAARGYPVHA